MKKFLLTLALLGPLLISSPALAESKYEMRVTPAVARIKLTPASESTQTINVKNTGQEPIIINLSAVPYSISTSGETDYTINTPLTQLSRWITFPQSEYLLTPDQTIAAPYIIETPASIPTGSQYAAILITMSDSTPSGIKAGSIKSDKSVLVRLSANSEGTTITTADILSNDLPLLYVSSPIHTKITLKNTGNTDYTATFYLSVKDPFSGDEKYSTHTQKDIYPDQTTTQEFTWEDSPSFGIFTINSTVAYLDQTNKSSRLVLVIPLWLLLIFTALAVALLALIIFLIYRHRLKKSKKHKK